MSEDFMIGPFYTDQQVAERIDPTGRLITARSIRTERDQGRLVGTRIAGKWLYAEADVGDWLAGARVLRRCADDSERIPELCGALTPGRDESTASVLADLKRRGNGSRSRREGVRWRKGGTL